MLWFSLLGNAEQIEGFLEGDFCFETDTMVRYQSQNAFLRDALASAGPHGMVKKNNTARCTAHQFSPYPVPCQPPLKVGPQTDTCWSVLVQTDSPPRPSLAELPF